MDEKTEALLQLLPSNLYEDAEVSETSKGYSITLHGVDDPDRQLDTHIHYSLMLADNTRISIQHDGDSKRVIEVSERTTD